MKFDVVIGNPPYQENTNDSELKLGQEKAVKNVFHYFQNLADDIAKEKSCLIYPGGRWIHQFGKGLGEFGKAQINSPWLSKLVFFPKADEVFSDVAIADGISIVFKNYKKETNTFEYSRLEDLQVKKIIAENPKEDLFILDPAHYTIVKKIKKFISNNNLNTISESECKSRSLFKIESDFVEKNPDKVRPYKEDQSFDRNCEIKLLTNDKAGKRGRATWFVAKKDVVTSNIEFLDKWKVIVSSANAGGQKRDNQLEVIDNYSAFGRARIALKMFDTREEALNCEKYFKSYIIRFAFLMTGENLTSLGKVVPDLLDYTAKNSLIDFSKNIDEQLSNKMDLTLDEFLFIKETIEAIR